MNREPMQMNSAGAVTLSGNPVNFSELQPQTNQNSAGGVVINTTPSLAAAAVVGGSGAGAVTLVGAISGGGGLVDSLKGTLTLSGANSYAGDTSITDGTLMIRCSGIVGGFRPRGLSK